MLYFDHSATTPIHPEVAQKIDYINREHYANPSSIYWSGRKARSVIEKARQQVAYAIGAKAEQIFFTSGGTEANNQVLWSKIAEKKKHIIVSSIEHPAILKVLKKVEPYGIISSIVPVDNQGTVEVDSLTSLINLAKNGKLEECNWLDVFQIIINKIKNTKPSQIAGFVGDLVDLESMYIFKEFFNNKSISSIISEEKESALLSKDSALSIFK